MRAALVLAATASVAVAGSAPTMIHSPSDLQQALASTAALPCIVASGSEECRPTLQSLGVINTVTKRDDLRLLLLSPDSAPELQSRFNLTGCNDMVFVEGGSALAEIDGATGEVVADADAAASAVAAEPVHFAPTSSHELEAQLTGFIELNIAFYNDFPFAVEVFWVHPSTGEEHHNARLAAGQTTTLVSFRRHRFVFKGQRMRNVLGYAEVSRHQTFSAREVAAAYAAETGEQTTCSYPEEGFPEDIEERRTLKNSHAACHERRLGHNRDQPGWVHHFLPVPFKKAKVPPAVWAEIMDFMAKNKNNEIREGWGPGDCYTNHMDVASTMVVLTDAVREKIYEGMRPLLAEWIGFKPEHLEHTSTYGVRWYYRGAVLFKHCDRVSTHAVSAIINVAQEGMDEPWPLQIHDHEGVEHTVYMEPGNCVFYESASAIHGREIPLNGTRMANLFTHFRPTANSPVSWVHRYPY